MGKQIYFTDKELKWLAENVGVLSGMEFYEEDEDERNMVDAVYGKLVKEE